MKIPLSLCRVAVYCHPRTCIVSTLAFLTVKQRVLPHRCRSKSRVRQEGLGRDTCLVNVMLLRQTALRLNSSFLLITRTQAHIQTRTLSGRSYFTFRRPPSRTMATPYSCLRGTGVRTSRFKTRPYIKAVDVISRTL